MKTATNDEILNHLGPRIKFLEKSYSNAYILISKVLLMKQSDFANSNKMLQIREGFKILPKPEFSLDDQRDVVDKIIDVAKASLREKVNDLKIDEVFEVFEKFSNSIIRYCQGRLVEGIAPSKAMTRQVEKVIKYSEHRINLFQKEARRPSMERNQSRDMTPKRPPSANLSVSPSEKRIHNVVHENSDLRESLKKITEERDFLKAWKENTLKAPSSLSEECNSIIKQQELFIKQLVISNKVLISKLQALFNSVNRFLKETSTFQRQVREKEGFNSVDSYETEKSKLKIKLKELSEVKDIQVYLFDFPFFGQNGSFDFTQFTEKYMNVQSENKTLRIQIRDLNKKIRKLECRSPDKSFLASPDKSFESPKKIDLNKNWAVAQFKIMSSYFERVFQDIQKKLNEKDSVIAEIRSKFVDNLGDNFKKFVQLKNEVKESIAQGDNPSKKHLSELESLIDQNRIYTESEIKESGLNLEKLRKDKNLLEEKNREIEKENWELKQRVLQLIDVEGLLSNAQSNAEELEGKLAILNKRLRDTKQREAVLEQVGYEKSIIELEVKKVKEELEEKDKVIEEISRNLSLDKIKFEAEKQGIVLRESTARKELELVRIEMNTYKMQIGVLENINEDLENEVKRLSNLDKV